MIKRHSSGAALALASAAATLLAGGAAHAQSQYVGAQAGTYTGSNFSVSGNQVLVGQTATAGTLSVPNAGVSGSLLGINGLWLVGAADVQALSATPAWTPEGPGTSTDTSGPAGFGGHPGYGSGPSSNWISLTPSVSGPNTSGVFNFSGLSDALAAGQSVDLGVDYLVQSGNTTKTGRTYFHLPGGPTPGAAVPEPGSLALLALGAPVVALAARRRKARS